MLKIRLLTLLRNILQALRLPYAEVEADLLDAVYEWMMGVDKRDRKV